MVNCVVALKSILHGFMKMAGLRQQTVEIEPGTIMTFWVPKDNTNNTNNDDGGNKEEKPVVVLVHGFAADGITTWQFQVGALTKLYSVYVPDLLFFGGSTTACEDRSPAFQAKCLAAALDQLGVRRCTVVGLSYGGTVAFNLTETRPDLVRSLVISGSVIAITDSISRHALERLGFSSSAELLLPESVEALKAVLSAITYKNRWFPRRLHQDFLEAMFENRKERAELLEGAISNEDAKVPTLSKKRILLLWGENDNMFNVDLAKNIKKQLGEGATMIAIEKAGHLVHLEQPFVYNQHLKEFLALVHPKASIKESPTSKFRRFMLAIASIWVYLACIPSIFPSN